jgi:nucleotide-binding universal stress UspA family protein
MIKNRIQKILVPLDGSENSFRGLDEAIIIARNGQTTITGVYVTPLSPPASTEQKTYIKNYLLKNANKFMKKAKTHSAQNGILFYEKIMHGDEGPKIVKFAHDRNFDLIVIGSR